MAGPRASATAALGEGEGEAYAFLSKVNGVVPGYGGHRPGAAAVCSASAYGGVPHPKGAQCHAPGDWRQAPHSGLQAGQGDRLRRGCATTQWMELGTEYKPPEPPSPNQNYLAASGGVKIGYTGFVPHSRRHFGSSHRGGVDGTRPDVQAQRRAQQGADVVPEGPATGTLLLPGMAEDAEFARVQPVARVPKQPVGGALIGYGGHRPRHVTVESGSSTPKLTPWRRFHAPLTDKVGEQYTAQPVPPDAAARDAARQPPPSARPVSAPSGERGRRSRRRPDAGPPTLRPSADALGVNDWSVHQSVPPPPLPADASEYVSAVGGVKAGYAGFVPHSAAHFGSSHIGMHERAAPGPTPQRGHLGKTDGSLLRVKADTAAVSPQAAAALVGWGGHLPGAQLTFGVSAWRDDDYSA